jgi:hypothetical protein
MDFNHYFCQGYLQEGGQREMLFYILKNELALLKSGGTKTVMLFKTPKEAEMWSTENNPCVSIVISEPDDLK